MKLKRGLGGAVRYIGQGMLEILVLVDEPFTVNTKSNPSRDMKRIRGDIRRAGRKTLNERKISFQTK